MESPWASKKASSRERRELTRSPFRTVRGRHARISTTSRRLVLDRMDLADLAIADLGRWRDWNSIDRIAALYGQGQSNLRFIKRAIIRYLWSCANAKPTDVRPEQAASAKRHLAELRIKEPQIVTAVERRMAEMPD